MDTSLMRESAESGNVIIKWNINFDSFRDQVFKIAQLFELVLAADVIAVCNDHTGHKTPERGDAVTLTDTEDRRVNVCGAGFESCVCVCDGAAGVVVEVGFDVAVDDTAEGADEVVDLTWAGAADSVRDTHSVDTNLANGSVDAQ